MSSAKILPPYFWRSFFVSSCYLLSHLPSDLLPSAFPTLVLYTYLMTMRATCPAHHPTWFDHLITRIMRFIIVQFFQHFVPFMDPSIFISKLFQYTLNRCLSVRETKFHTHTKQQKANYPSFPRTVYQSISTNVRLQKQEQQQRSSRPSTETSVCNVGYAYFTMNCSRRTVS